MKILICGDSYCITDPTYPGLHWSEKILESNREHEVINLANGGCSNALIALQLLQGLRYKPDFIIFSFTSCERLEFDKDDTVLPESLDPHGLISYINKRYTTTCYPMSPENEDAYKRWLIHSSSELEKIKNYFYICFCLMTLKSKNIKFCYSLGGFEFQQDYTFVLKQNYANNILKQFKEHELSTNLWCFGRKSEPWFHVDDEKVQMLFANECMEKYHG